MPCSTMVTWSCEPQLHEQLSLQAFTRQSVSHHHHPGNNFRLADDLMEPFRPLVDRMVVKLIKIGEIDVTPETKKMLASLTTVDMVTEAGTSPLSTCLLRLATSLARAFETGQARLDFPIRPLPLEMPDH